MKKLIFAVLLMCHSTMGFTHCYKKAVFIYIAVFRSQSIAEILLGLLSLSENKRTPYGNSTSGFDSGLFNTKFSDLIYDLFIVQPSNP